jgi:hypothetical protein
MPRPDAVRRVKSYSAATGFVYQYYFFEVERAQRGTVAGADYTYMVSLDRATSFPLKIFVEKAALDAYTRRTRRALTGTEEYALAKMRLFAAFDEAAVPTNAADGAACDFRVDDSNIEGLLAQLDL